MAKCTTSVRTNLFHVVDEAAFLDFMSGVIVDGEEPIEFLLDEDSQGLPIFGFATNGMIIGVSSPFDGVDECDEDAYGNFISGLQECVADYDAIIIMETTVSDDYDVVSTATIITCDDSDFVDFREMVSDRAADMLRTNYGDESTSFYSTERG